MTDPSLRALIGDTTDVMNPDDPQLHRAVGRLLGDARQAAGIPQRVAAQRIGTAQSRLARLELGKRRLLFWEALALAKLYGVSIGAFDPRQRSRADISPLPERRPRVDLARGPRQQRGSD